jgi:putative SOS response-associated peptidase YedK
LCFKLGFAVEGTHGFAYALDRSCVRDDAGRRTLDVMQWGVPLKMKGAKGQPITKQVTNVRNLTSLFWKSTIAKADFRCLAPVTDFCEWEGDWR